MVYPGARNADRAIYDPCGLSYADCAFCAGGMCESDRIVPDASDDLALFFQMLGFYAGRDHDRVRNGSISVLFAGEWIGPSAAGMYSFCDGRVYDL